MVIKFWISWIIESAVFTCVTMGPLLRQARDKKYLRQLRINIKTFPHCHHSGQQENCKQIHTIKENASLHHKRCKCLWGRPRVSQPEAVVIVVWFKKHDVAWALDNHLMAFTGYTSACHSFCPNKFQNASENTEHFCSILHPEINSELNKCSRG